MTQQPKSQLLVRRAELIAELFLQDLNAEYVARPTTDIVGYDFFVGFLNDKGGVNNYVVEIKATERAVSTTFPIHKKTFERLTHSNIPALLLVVDVKQNRIFYSWLRGGVKSRRANMFVQIPVTEVDDVVKEELRRELRR